jgi:CheY-like chemotaxis protein
MTKQILVVDDNADLRFAVVECLKNTKYKVTEAESGKKAMELLAKNHFDAVLLDIMMPEMDGWEVAARIKENPKTRTLPVLFLTAKTDMMSEKVGKMAAEEYIEKPFNSQNLIARLGKVLKNR